MMLCVCFSYVDNSTNFSLVERLKATEDLKFTKTLKLQKNAQIVK